MTAFFIIWAFVMVIILGFWLSNVAKRVERLEKEQRRSQ